MGGDASIAPIRSARISCQETSPIMLGSTHRFLRGTPKDLPPRLTFFHYPLLWAQTSYHKLSGQGADTPPPTTELGLLAERENMLNSSQTLSCSLCQGVVHIPSANRPAPRMGLAQLAPPMHTLLSGGVKIFFKIWPPMHKARQVNRLRQTRREEKSCLREAGRVVGRREAGQRSRPGVRRPLVRGDATIAC